MSIVLGFSCLLIWVAAIQKFLPVRLRQYGPLCAISVIGLANYYLVFLFKFSTAQYLVYFLSAVLSVYLYKRKLVTLSNVIQENKVFLGFSLFIFVFTLNARIYGWDEFFWASFVRYIAITDKFWTASAQLVHGEYLPGIPIWQKFFVGNSLLADEQPLFFAMGLIFYSGFVALRPQNWDFKKSLFLFLVYCTVIYGFFVSGAGSLYVDCAVSILVGLILVSIFEIKTFREIAIPISLILFLGITKDTSFLLALLCCFVLTLKLIREKQFFTRSMCAVALTTSLVLINYFIWQRHLASIGLEFPMARQILASFISDVGHLSARTETTLLIFLKATLSIPIPQSRWEFFGGNLLSTFAVIAACLLLIRQRYEFIVGYIIGFIGYAAAILSFWLYVTSEYEGNILASYSRYFGVFFLSFLILLIRIGIDKKLFETKKYKIAIIFLIVLFLPSLQLLFPPTFKANVYKLTGLPYAKYTASFTEVKPLVDQVNKVAKPYSRIWLIWQNSSGAQLMVLRYELLPHIVTSLEFSLGDKYYEGDVWTASLNEAQFQQNLNRCDYIAMGSVDDQFIRKYGTFFIDEPKANSVYKKIVTTDGIKLTLAQQEGSV